MYGRLGHVAHEVRPPKPQVGGSIVQETDVLNDIHGEWREKGNFAVAADARHVKEATEKGKSATLRLRNLG